MPTLTKDNAKHHCRTCLKSLMLKESPSEEENNEKELEHTINITTNGKLKRLIAEYIDGKLFGAAMDMPEIPQNVCMACYNKLQSFEVFQKTALDNAEKLFALLGVGCSNNVTKLEVDMDYEAAENDQEDSKILSNDDIYKLLVKNALMETESVMLNDSAAVDALADSEMHDPDPFDNATLESSNSGNKADDGVLDKEDKYGWHKTECQDSDSSESTNHSSVSKKYAGKDESETEMKEFLSEKIKDEISNDGALTDKEENRGRCTRSRGKTKTEIARCEKKNKKRRNKKEMEEWRKSKTEKHESKIKRRNRGTKNTFKCTQCNHCFAHKLTLNAHVRKVHEGNKRPFQCDRCEKCYTFIGGLYTHIKEIHEAKVRSYSCDFPGCNRIYTSFVAMQKHKRLKHSDNYYEKKYVCEQCGATFNQSSNLKHHRRTKHPTEIEQAEQQESKERFECEVCKKFFHSRYTLKYHTLQLHSNDMKYECNVCGRRMAKKFMLVQHMQVHSTDKMPCEQCGRQFIRKFELETHIRAVHMKLKPFECQYCSECFASRKTLRHHEYIHTGEKPYVCNICGQAYRQQTCLKKHRKSHEKLNAESLLTPNMNPSFMSTFLNPQHALTDAGAPPAIN